MEGYLIRLPASAWNVDNDTTSQRTARRSRRSFRPQARLLYYVLGEGYLEGFASPDDVESVESFQLTSFEVGVDPIYSMCIFKVTTHKKRPAGQPVRDVADTPDDNSDNDDEAGGSSLLLFAADRTLVELWGRKLLNWNRYVFAGAPFSAETSDLGQAKRDLITAFHEKNNHGMFSVICSLQDCTTTPGTEGAADQCANTNTAEDEQIRTPPILPTPMPTPTTIVDKLQESATRTEIKPLWMLLHRGSSRRIRSVPMTK